MKFKRKNVEIIKRLIIFLQSEKKNAFKKVFTGNFVKNIIKEIKTHFQKFSRK